jgi:hypothetical protein
VVQLNGMIKKFDVQKVAVHDVPPRREHTELSVAEYPWIARRWAIVEQRRFGHCPIGDIA